MESIQKQKFSLLMGNEAIAQGLLDEGAEYFAAYPGTPSTEIMDYAFEHKDESNVIVHWSTNEAVAMEEVAAAAIGGKFAVYVSKHVGLNVAADPFLTLAYMGVRGALVLCVADDPSMHSSQNEQDTRWFGRLAHVPVIEPTDPTNAYTLARKALQLSHTLETPVILRITTRISHGLAPITFDKPKSKIDIPYLRDPGRFVNIPGNARKNKQRLNKAMSTAASLADTLDWTYKVISNGNKFGIISSGTAASYSEEIINGSNTYDLFISYLTHPLPKDKIQDFLQRHEKVLIVEELDDVLEREVKLIAFENEIKVKIHGKDVISKDYELNTLLIRNGINTLFGEKIIKLNTVEVDPSHLIMRPPNLCIGCPHRATYYALTRALKNKDTVYANDVGCYSLGVLPPYNAADVLICMGGSIGMATGFASAFPEKTVVATIGDSTFWHSGIPGLANALWHNANVIFVIMDNSTTAMTGMQENPSTNQKVDIVDTVKGMGAKVWEVDAFDVKNFMKIVKEAADMPGVKVIVSQGPCVIYDRKELKTERTEIAVVNNEICNMCGICTEKVNCPGIMVVNDQIHIDDTQCTGCALCVIACPRDAINLEELI
jgi:indolepyruvate ferredoxin oxidoreductase, alpha subunit